MANPIRLDICSLCGKPALCASGNINAFVCLECFEMTNGTTKDFGEGRLNSPGRKDAVEGGSLMNPLLSKVSSTRDLSILCVTRAEQCVLPLLHKLRVNALDLYAEFVLVADGEEAHYILSHNDFDHLSKGSNIPIVHSKGYIESVLDEAIEFTSGKWILRIDDDESISPQLLKWLASGQYTQHDHWKFPRVHLYGDEFHYITNPPLWPDHQTRLSVRSKSGGRHTIHCGSPFGGGELAPVPIYHHKFLVKSTETRQEIINRYERLQAGAGVNFIPFSLPEQVRDNWQVGLLKDLEL